MRAPALASRAWTTSHSILIWGTGSNTVITGANDVDTIFYQLRVTLP